MRREEFDEIDDIVLRAVGITSGPQSATPWQLLMTHTRKAIAKEDNIRTNDAHIDCKNGALSPMSILVDIEDKPQIFDSWLSLYPARDGGIGERYAGDIYKDEIRDPNPLEIRHALDIVRYTADQKQADEYLNVNQSQPDKEISETKKLKWSKCRPGFHKLRRCIVANLEEIPKPCSSHTRVKVKIGGNIHELGRAVPRHYFGPILTVWLLAMGPHVTHRVFVIRKAIENLKAFYDHNRMIQGGFNGGKTGPPPMFTGTPERINEMRDWYAFHTLRRMFRMRTGCCMCMAKQDGKWLPLMEMTSSLDQVDPNQDEAWTTFLQMERQRTNELRDSLGIV